MLLFIDSPLTAMTAATFVFAPAARPARAMRAVSLRQALQAQVRQIGRRIRTELVRTAVQRAAPHLRHLAQQYELDHPALAAELRRLGTPHART
ncbi:MAG: hypothetical protein C4K60_13820 [Ideonella sp. MAG2]|nr:MAG: hypothetical protein C4K60_13820 [Ideonella sp. MAG2]